MFFGHNIDCLLYGCACPSPAPSIIPEAERPWDDWEKYTAAENNEVVVQENAETFDTRNHARRMLEQGQPTGS